MATKYDPQRFKHYKERKYKEYAICQLEGCERPVKHFGDKRRNKYCCTQHANKAKRIYKRLWELKNSDKVKEYKEKYKIRKLTVPEEVGIKKKKRKKETKPRKPYKKRIVKNPSI